MAGIDENIGWTTPADPSPRSYFASFMDDDLLLEHEKTREPFTAPDKHSCISVDKGDDIGMEASGVPVSESHVLSIPKPTSRSGLAERMAARGGFNAPKLNTAQIKPNTLRPSSPEAQSSYLMLSPGVSPTILLESPVFLLNSLAQPSPTTGKFVVEQYTNSSSILASEHADKNKELYSEPFAFKPHLETNSSCFSTALTKMDATNDQQQPLPNIMVTVHQENPNRSCAIETSSFSAPSNRERQFQSISSDMPGKQDPSGDFTFNQEGADSALGNENSPALIDQLEGEEQKGDISSFAIGQPSEDGYNWRKYGQKQVKGSEFPRSYYKCTNPNCQVKKKVERSPEGHVTEIIYKGKHCHPKPPLNRRAAGSSSLPFGEMPMDDMENHSSHQNIDGRSMWSTQNGTAGSDWRSDGMEAPSCTTVTTDFCDSSFNTQDIPRFDGADAIDVSSTLSNEEEDDQENHGSIGDGDESESKRRKLDVSVMDVGAASRAVREPRVVVQTTSEVDILDDGYRWRKYGQKVVKGNPNPRSYYKCTSAGCTVRKHVERASHDLKSVITTYEGKHNHEVPAARNSSHASSGSAGSNSTQAPQNHNIHRRPDPCQVQENFPRFDAPVAMGNFGITGREQLGPTAGFPFGLVQPGLSNLTMSGLSSASPLKMLPPLHSYPGMRPLTDAGFMIPKGEPKEELASESNLLISSGPSAASAYQQLMSRLPLGPQL